MLGFKGDVVDVAVGPEEVVEVLMMLLLVELKALELTDSAVVGVVRTLLVATLELE